MPSNGQHEHLGPGLWGQTRNSGTSFSFQCQAKFLTSEKILTCYYLSVILLLTVKEYSLAITFLLYVIEIKTFWLGVRYPEEDIAQK